MDSPTVATVISKLLLKERQKSVISMASLKLFRLHALGSDRMPLILLVISEGCLNAITIVRYNGRMIVESPRIRTIIAVLFVFFIVITAPPFYRKISSAPRKPPRSR